MNTLTLRLLVAIVPLIMLMGTFTVSKIIRKHHVKRAVKMITASALEGLSHGPQLRG